MQERNEVQRAEPRPQPTGDVMRSYGTFAGLAAVLLAAVIVLLVLVYFAIESAFGKGGVQVTLALLGFAGLWLLISRQQANMRSQSMKDVTEVIAAMTMHDVTIQQSDDKGEIMRVMAPKLLDLMGKREGATNQQALAMFNGALGLQRMLPQQPSAWAALEDGQGLDESAFNMDLDDE